MDKEYADSLQPEAEIRAALAAGDKRRALTLMMTHYGNDIFRFVYSGDSAAAEDVRQDVFFQAYRDIEGYSGLSTVKGWLLGIARHRYLDHAKSRSRWFNRFKHDSVEEPSDDGELETSCQRHLDRDRLARLLTTCLAGLPAATRSAVLLHYQQDLTYEEAAEIEHEKPGTLQQRVARAMRRLRKCVELRSHARGPR